MLGKNGGVLASEIITAGQAVKMVLEDGQASITVAEFDTQRCPAFVQEALAHPEDWNAQDGEPSAPLPRSAPTGPAPRRSPW